MREISLKGTFVEVGGETEGEEAGTNVDDEELIKSEADFTSDTVEDIEFEGGSKGGDVLSAVIR